MSFLGRGAACFESSDVAVYAVRRVEGMLQRLVPTMRSVACLSLFAPSMCFVYVLSCKTDSRQYSCHLASTSILFISTVVGKIRKLIVVATIKISVFD